MVDLIRYFDGSWRLRRAIADVKAGCMGRVAGQVDFTVTGDDVRLYHEQGLLRFGTYRGAAHRIYRFFSEAPGALSVLFDDERPFFDAQFFHGAAQFTHLCGADRYDGAIEILSPNCWRWRWTIRGPRKDLVLRSVYHRLAGADAC